MLTRLGITDFALLRRAEVSFTAGLTAITGETGAGKSLLVGAINFLGGQKAPFGAVSSGARKAVVEGEFQLADGSSVLLRRELFADGRSRAFIDDESASGKELARVAAKLLDVTSQRAFSRLLEPSRHLDFLDAFAGLTESCRKMARYEEDFQQVEVRIKSVRRRLKEYNERREFLQYQLREIEQAAPAPDEDTQLDRELERLEHIEEIRQDGERIAWLLTDDAESVESRLSEVQKLAAHVATFDSAVKELIDDIESARSSLKDISRRIQSRCRIERYDPSSLEQMRERRRILSGLARRFGGSLYSVLERAEGFKKELAEGSSLESDLEGLIKERRDILTQWSAAAVAVSQSRKAAQPELAASVKKSLRGLGASDAEFEIRIQHRADPGGLFEDEAGRWKMTGRGLEEVEFYFSANPGIEPRPVAVIASGGELSRIMLALKEVLPPESDEATILFDEIDAGVSGRVARLVGYKLRHLSAGRQMLVITHLPQIASLADRHLKVVKYETEGTTATEVVELDGEDRVIELAGMLSGGSVSTPARDQARRLLAGD